MIKSDVQFAPPPIPSVVIELGLSSRHSRMPSSCVAALLTKLLPGFSSDATLDQIVQHVVDCGQVQALVDCSIRDNCDLVNVLEKQYGITRFPPGHALSGQRRSVPARLACRRADLARESQATSRMGLLSLGGSMRVLSTAATLKQPPCVEIW